MRRSYEATALVCGLLASVTACNKASRGTVDSAAGVTASPTRGALSFVDVDIGRHVGDDRKVTDKTDDFAPTDTIFASVHTSGRATKEPLVGRWTFENGNTIAEEVDTVTTSGNAYSAFFIMKRGGLPKGKYTLHVLINGSEVRTKDATVK
jgi:hypothetical protein